MRPRQCESAIAPSLRRSPPLSPCAPPTVIDDELMVASSIPNIPEDERSPQWRSNCRPRLWGIPPYLKLLNIPFKKPFSKNSTKSIKIKSKLTRILIPDKLGQLDGIIEHRLSQSLVNIERGRNLDHLLMTTLHRALALAEVHHVAWKSRSVREGNKQITNHDDHRATALQYVVVGE